MNPHFISESEVLLPEALTLAKYWITFLVFSGLPAPDSPLAEKHQRSKRIRASGCTRFVGNPNLETGSTSCPYVISIDWWPCPAMTGHERGRQTVRVWQRRVIAADFPQTTADVLCQRREQRRQLSALPWCRIMAAKPFITPWTNHHTAHWLHTSSNCPLQNVQLCNNIPPACFSSLPTFPPSHHPSLTSDWLTCPRLCVVLLMTKQTFFSQQLLF